MNYFTIKDIEALTGIKPHTIRVWEQRYKLVEPKRTSTNIRFYNDEDLKTLLNISLLNRNGYKISRISKLSRQEIDRIIIEECSCTDYKNCQVQALMACMLSLDEASFNHILCANIEKTGLRSTMLEVVFPFLNHLGMLWMAGTINPAYEHFVSNIIKKRLFTAIDQLGHPVDSEKTKKFLLFLPEGETHVIGLLFGNYLIRAAGHQSLYLGQDLPDREIDLVINTYKPQFILTSVISGMTPAKIKEWIQAIATRFPEKRFLVTGNGFLNSTIPLPSNVTLIRSPNCLDSILAV